ncbi:hypothetical protein BVY04_04180 [bacterium M21]|nr:hypothetical protein BVY04_04180 [bacterium M21]
MVLPQEPEESHTESKGTLKELLQMNLRTVKGTRNLQYTILLLPGWIFERIVRKVQSFRNFLAQVTDV